MANVGRTVGNTLGKTPITFAMIELAETPDCNARKQQWLNYGFTDVTPQFAARSTVPTLDDAVVAQGRQMLEDMKSVNADWYMLSGHHGAIYGSEYERFTTDGAALKTDMSNLDMDRLYSTEEYCGFFNESYHKLYFNHGSRDDPDLQKFHQQLQDSNPKRLPDYDKYLANSIYLRTTDAAPASVGGAQTQDNPWFDRPTPVSQTKGVIISACNTLVYDTTRKTWNTYFPNAVIIGTVARINSGTWVTNAIAAAAMTNESFWRDPQSILDQPGKCEELQGQLRQHFPDSSEIGVLYKNQLYRNVG